MPNQPEKRPGEMNVIELFLLLVREAGGLVRSHMRLASTEIRKKVGRAGMYVAFLAAGVIILYLCLLAAVASAVVVLAIFVPLWVSAVVVTLVLLLAGGVLSLAALSKLKKMDWRPSKTIEAFKESVRWLKMTRSGEK